MNMYCIWNIDDAQPSRQVPHHARTARRVLRTRRQFLTLKDPCSDTNKGAGGGEDGGGWLEADSGEVRRKFKANPC